MEKIIKIIILSIAISAIVSDIILTDIITYNIIAKELQTTTINVVGTILIIETSLIVCLIRTLLYEIYEIKNIIFTNILLCIYMYITTVLEKVKIMQKKIDVALQKTKHTVQIYNKNEENIFKKYQLLKETQKDIYVDNIINFKQIAIEMFYSINIINVIIIAVLLCVFIQKYIQKYS